MLLIFSAPLQKLLYYGLLAEQLFGCCAPCPDQKKEANSAEIETVKRFTRSFCVICREIFAAKGAFTPEGIEQAKLQMATVQLETSFIFRELCIRLAGLPEFVGGQKAWRAGAPCWL